MQNTPQKILFWFKASPFESLAFREGLDAALAFAAFDQKVTLYFDSNALLALYTDINPKTIEQKDISKNLKALPMYDISNVFFNPNAFQQGSKLGINLISTALPLPVSKLGLSDYHQTFVY